MKFAILAILIGLSSLSFAHNRGSNCRESIECLESASDCFPVRDKTYTVIFLVRKSVTCMNHYGNNDTIVSTERETFETSLSRNTCELYKANIKKAYGDCE